jgi:HEAT repeat protein/DNA-binding MarR family transcriptional regulator
MTAGALPSPGPFRGLAPYDESSTALFFGRAEETATLLKLVTKDGDQITALTGEPGVGKTSLLCAGLIPALAKHEVAGVYLSNYLDLEQELWQAVAHVSGEPPSPGDRAADYLVRLAQSSPAGTLLILDHLESVVGEGDIEKPILTQLAELLEKASAAAGPRLRILLCIESALFHRLDRLYAACKLSPAPGAWMELRRLSQESAALVLEQTALNTGTFFEAGLAGIMAGDLCRGGTCLPADLQVVARTALETRLTSVRRYERSGGAAALLHNFLHRAVTQAGGHQAGRVLLAAAQREASSVASLATRTGLATSKVDEVVGVLVARGVLVKAPGTTDRYLPAHPALVSHIQAYAAGDTAGMHEARRILRRRILAGERLKLREIRKVRHFLGRDLASDEAAVFRRSVRRAVLHIGLGSAVTLTILLGLLFELRSSYTLAFDPARDAPGSRVVVRRGRQSLSFLNILPANPRFGSVIADTGFAANGISTELAARIASGQATGGLDLKRTQPIPGWLRSVLDGLGPVQRGVSMVLLGDPNGVVSLKQAFADPALRRETLEALAVVGTGRAGEDEILAAALNDPSPEVRRRGVEVAAAIDRRQVKGSHAATLRGALADQSFAVRTTALAECSTLEPATAASILSVALADKDVSFRRMAEKALLDLSVRSPGAAADAVRLALWSTDGLARKTALGILDQIAVRAPTEAVTSLSQIASDETAPEEARVAALSYLRRTGAVLTDLRPMLEKAVLPDASPRLRTVALPLYARLIEPAKVSELAVAAIKGPPATRVTGAALWGVVAIKQPDLATKPLKGLVYDPSPEVRVEAARAFGYLKREGPELVRKSLLDPNAEVQKAAIESALRLAAAQPGVVAEMLGHVVANVRPAARRSIVEALGEIGRTRPAAVLPALVRAFKLGDVSTRGAAARALCEVAKKAPAATSPYLRLAAHDTDRDVRTEAAACLGSLTEGDPKGAARMAIQLATSDEAAVRAAAAASLGALSAQVQDLALAPLIGLLEDPDRTVRVATAEALIAYAKSRAPLGKRAADLEKKLSAFFVQGDVDERHLALRVASRNGLTAILRQAARDADENLRLEAMRAAAACEPPAIEILQAGAEDRDALVRAEAVRDLATASGSGSAQVLPVFQAMLRAGDPATRRAGALALGTVSGAPKATTAMLASVLRQRGESVRAAATDAIARIAQRDPAAAGPLLEQAIADPAHDVRSAAVHGLATVWARLKQPGDLAQILSTSEADSARRLVAVQALVLQAAPTWPDKDAAKEARTKLEEAARSGPPLARLAAQVGRAFMGASPEDMVAFFEKLYGG